MTEIRNAGIQQSSSPNPPNASDAYRLPTAGIERTGAHAETASEGKPLSQPEQAALALYLNQLCAALVEATRLQPQPAQDPAPDARELLADNEEPPQPSEQAALTAEAATDPNIPRPNPEAEVAELTRVETRNESAADTPIFDKSDLKETDFWDAVAAQHAAQSPGCANNEQSVFDAVAEVAASRPREPLAVQRAAAELSESVKQAPVASTQETERRSIDIIAAFESLFGIDEPEASSPRPHDVLRHKAERAVFAALTFAESTTLCASGRRG